MSIYCLLLLHGYRSPVHSDFLESKNMVFIFIGAIIKSLKIIVLVKGILFTKNRILKWAENGYLQQVTFYFSALFSFGIYY